MKNFLFVFKFIAKIIYAFLKLLPIQNKVVLISRFNKETSIDFQLLENEIKNVNPNIKVKILNHKLKNKFLLISDVLIEMYHLATSNSAIIDSYVIPVSILKHKKDLVIIQIWHAIGSIKKFGHASLNTKEGASHKTATIMDMHKNYTYVITSGHDTIPFYAEAFNIERKRIKAIGMPRVDYLNSLEIKNQKKNEIYNVYPILKTKKNILYAPTFRKNENIPYEEIIKKIDFNRYNLIIKKHINDISEIKTDRNIIIDQQFHHTDMLFVADYIITDYSAIAFEAAALLIPTYFFVYDIEKYKKNRGLFINFNEDKFPGFVSSNSNDIVNAIEQNIHNISEMKRFKEKYIANTNGISTKRIIELLELKGGYEYDPVVEKVINWFS